MNKVITINLGGLAFQLEDEGYDALRAYLDTARNRLRNNPDRNEILSDVERAIAEKFQAVLTSYKNVVTVKEVQDAVAQMGEIQDETTAAEEPRSADAQQASGQPTDEPTDEPPRFGAPRRLYCIREGAQLSGVCNGIGAYFGIDPTIIRLGFIALVLAWGSGIFVYLVLALVLPEAKTPEQKAEATGSPSTAQEFIRRAKAGYYSTMRSFPDRAARREWNRRFTRNVRDWQRGMHAHAGAWRQNWHRYHAAHPGAAIALPIVSLLHGAFVVAWLAALISVLSTSALFGVPLPEELPVWGAVLILILLHAILVWPLKTARRAFYYAGPGGPEWTVFILIDIVVWIAVVGVLIWLARDYLPHARDALQHLPGVVRDGANAFRDWWRQ